MAATGEPTTGFQSEPSRPEIVRLSSDSNDAYTPPASFSDKRELLSPDDFREPQQDGEPNHDEFGEEQDEDQDPDGDQFSDTSSFINDLVYMDNKNDADNEYDHVDVCTPEEALAYRRRLHQLGPEQFVAETIESDAITAKKLLTAFGALPPQCFEGSPDSRYYRMLGILIMEELMKRKKLPQYNDIDDAVKLLKEAKNVIVITGAGISTNLGIPDFRSKDTGFYAKMQAKGFSSGEEVFDIQLFNDDPSVFYDNCGETFPVAGITTPTHEFIRLLQDRDKLLRNYTQNIDNIEASAGIKKENLIQCHGSWATATCRKCGTQVPGHDLLDEVKAGNVPKCRKCVEAFQNPTENGSLKRKRANGSAAPSSKSQKRNFDYEDDSSDDGKYDVPEPGVMKPDITFFGEALPATFFDSFNGHDKDVVDLVLVIGTSMKVAPVSEIPMALARSIPHIYISRDPCNHIGFDITFLGDCDVIAGELARRLGWPLHHKMLSRDQAVSVTLHDEEKAVWKVDAVV